MFRRKDKSPSDGFYEAFSDIIFATMAIFVLLMTIFLVVVRVSDVPQQAEPQIQSQGADDIAACVAQRFVIEEQQREREANATRAVAELNQEIQKLQADIEALNSETQALSARASRARPEVKDTPIEIAIALDKSNSMAHEIDNLENAVLRLAQLLPLISEKVTISIVAYRNNSAGYDASAYFQRRWIRPYQDDGGASLNALRRFLQAQQAEAGAAPILEATQWALSTFSAAHPKKRQVLMVLGDVGPYETPRGGINMGAWGQTRARQFSALVSQWTRASPQQRKLILHFSGLDELNGWQRAKHRASRDLFQHTARSAGQPDAYRESIATMYVYFLIAALERK